MLSMDNLMQQSFMEKIHRGDKMYVFLQTETSLPLSDVELQFNKCVYRERYVSMSNVLEHVY